MTQCKRIRLDGREYVWTGSGWYDARDYVTPTHAVIGRLNARLEEELASEDAAISDPAALVARAGAARDAAQYRRAEKLARRALTLRPGDHAALAVLCSILRASGFPQQAIEETDPFQEEPCPALLISRATALCDLRRWEEAKREISRALAIERSDPALVVIRRIWVARPDLCRRGEVYPR